MSLESAGKLPTSNGWMVSSIEAARVTLELTMTLSFSFSFSSFFDDNVPFELWLTRLGEPSLQPSYNFPKHREDIEERCG